MPKLILVIEDNEKNMLLMRDILTYHQYDVIEATDGEMGIKLAREKKPDLIFMDIQMPVMDGFTAANILKTDPQTKNIKIIGITSYAMKGDKEKILDAGFDDYISKPINTRQLHEVVKNIIG
ncbi:MAG: Response regulator receiver protein [uncultured bacterium]|nr:MAG: Response regulator receiver protein [uncultured bacterium]